MLKLIRRPNEEAIPPSASGVGPAQICEVGEDNLVRVTWSGHQTPETAWAALAVYGAYTPEIGDRVLVSGSDDEGRYVIGVLQSTQADGQTREIRSDQGASAHLRDSEAGERIEIRDRDDQLMISFDVESGHAVVNVPNGDLALRAPEGYIDLAAGKGLRCASTGAIQFESRSSLGMTVRGSEPGERSAAVQLAPHGTVVSGNTVGVSAGSTDVRTRDARFTSETLTSRVANARISFGKLESIVGRLIARAKNIYRRVEGTEQVEAGQSRTIVKGTHTVRAKSSYHKTEGDVKIDGAHIHLG